MADGWFQQNDQIEIKLLSRICVKNLPKHVAEDRLRDFFSQKGEVADAKLMRTKDGKSRQFGFVGFRSEREAVEALKFFNNSYMDTCRITCEIARKVGDLDIPRPRSKHSLKKQEKLVEEKKKATLPKSLSLKRTNGEKKENENHDPQLEEFLQVMQPRTTILFWERLVLRIKSLRLPMRFGNHRGGLAFVEYVTKQEAQNALQTLSNTHLYGRHLVLERAKEGKSLEELRARTAAQFTNEQNGFQNPGKLWKKRKNVPVLDEGYVGGKDEKNLDPHFASPPLVTPLRHRHRQLKECRQAPILLTAPPPPPSVKYHHLPVPPPVGSAPLIYSPLSLRSPTPVSHQSSLPPPPPKEKFLNFQTAKASGAIVDTGLLATFHSLRRRTEQQLQWRKYSAPEEQTAMDVTESLANKDSSLKEVEADPSVEAITYKLVQDVTNKCEKLRRDSMLDQACCKELFEAEQRLYRLQATFSKKVELERKQEKKPSLGFAFCPDEREIITRYLMIRCMGNARTSCPIETELDVYAKDPRELIGNGLVK
ncbi:hypothetical protein LguiA_013057 [Lonicera macranthoides]